MKGWPIGTLAQEADVAISTIRRLETGLTVEPSEKTRRALSRVLKVRASKRSRRAGQAQRLRRVP